MSDLSPEQNSPSPEMHQSSAADLPGRPKAVPGGRALIITAAVVWIPVAGEFLGLGEALLLILCVVFAVRAGGGRRGARTAVTVIVVLLLIIMAPFAWLGFTDPDIPTGPSYAVMDIIAIAASGTGVALLFAPGSNTYFRAQRDTSAGHRAPAGAQVSDRMPGSIRWVLVGVWFQAAVNGLGGWWLLSEVNDRLDHGQEVSQLGLVRASAYLSFIIAAVLVISGIFALRRFAWVRGTVVTIEGLAVLGAIAGLFFGVGPSSLIGLALAIWIGSVMLGQRGRDWFCRPANLRDERTTGDRA